MALIQQPKCFLRASSSSPSAHITFMMLTVLVFPEWLGVNRLCVCLRPGAPAAFSPGNLSTSSSASSTLGSPDNDEYILSFETIDKMRRVSSYSSLNSLIGNCYCSNSEAVLICAKKRNFVFIYRSCTAHVTLSMLQSISVSSRIFLQGLW